MSLVANVGYFFAYARINSANGADGIDVFRNIYSGTMYGQWREVFVYSVVVLASATALIYVLNQRHLAKIMVSPFLALVGKVSYGGVCVSFDFPIGSCGSVSTDRDVFDGGPRRMVFHCVVTDGYRCVRLLPLV